MFDVVGKVKFRAEADRLTQGALLAGGVRTHIFLWGLPCRPTVPHEAIHGLCTWCFLRQSHWRLTPKVNTNNYNLGAIHNCQHLKECTKHTFSYPLLPQKLSRSTFFKWIICQENDKKKNGLKC